ncbi:DUF6801 domain-containing protein [Actinophytocola xanthii]|uniref:DUF6801 domain-containing protein n=1 Tax=Actinophytocola xanthii TaxID=1912961 RepID=A0A1Q8CGW0_9PSEU|nr:DUF6801 domain-containing protein [Actinophytocola xanthii]OLF13615.1 hypothetical protein BU204_26615 [Actinophytocola xanthii]
MRGRFLPVAGLVAAFLAPVPAAGQPAAVPAELLVRHTCQLPSGAQPLEVRISAQLPAAGEVGVPIEPSAAVLTLTPPVADLPEASALTVVARQETTVLGEPVTWSGALSDLVPVGEVAVPLESPPVVATEPGDMAFTTGPLTLEVTGYRADGLPTEPPTLDLTCTPDPDQPLDLGVVPVLAPPPSSEPSPPPPPDAVVVEPPTSTETEEGRAAVPAPRVEIPPDCEIIDPPPGPTTPARYCAYVIGAANVAKLDASVLQPAGIVNIAPTSFYVPCEGDAKLRCQQANILPNLNGEPSLPEGESWLLPFDFVPTKAKLQLTQIGLGFADVRLDSQAPHARSGAVITGKYSARIFDAQINGVPLDLGENCRSESPLEVSVRANVPPYTLTVGGKLTGMVTIPPFSGCGAHEDLDPLITGLVSGPGNYVELIQGRICTLTGSQNGCPPRIPER